MSLFHEERGLSVRHSHMELICTRTVSTALNTWYDQHTFLRIALTWFLGGFLVLEVTHLNIRQLSYRPAHASNRRNVRLDRCDTINSELAGSIVQHR